MRSVTNHCPNSQPTTEALLTTNTSGMSSGCQSPGAVADDSSQITFLLTFKNPSLEKEFLDAANAAWTKCDLLACKLSIVSAVTRIFSWKNPNLIPTLVHHASVVVFAVLLPLLLLKRMLYDPIEYQKQRIAMFPYLKLFLGAAQAVVIYLDSSLFVGPSTGVHLLVWNLLCKSTIPMMVLAVGPPLPFKHHVVVQAVCTLLGMAWVGNLCSGDRQNDELRTAIHVFGWRTEGILRKLSFGGFLSDSTCPSPGEYPCWLWGVFSTVLIVFILPSYLLYLLEYRFRVQFLQRRMQEEPTVFLVGRVVMISLFVVVLSQLVWFKAKLLAM